MKKIAGILLFTLFATACIQKVSEEDISKVIEAHPELVIRAIEKDPEKVLVALNKAMENRKAEESKKAEMEQEQAMENEFSNPKKPKLLDSYNYRGAKDAIITIVEYSDFQCPYCSQGFNSLMDVLKKYDGKVRFTYKHLPLPFHPQAMITAKYYEAIAIQNKEVAWKFHDTIFSSQEKLNGGENFLKETAKKLGVDMNKLAKDIDSDAVKNKIQEDSEEAQRFGFNGTPAFLINGVSLVGAQPIDQFEKIIDRQLKKS